MHALAAFILIISLFFGIGLLVLGLCASAMSDSTAEDAEPIIWLGGIIIVLGIAAFLTIA